jgi:Tfp pilus assembly protein PilO
MKARLVFLGAVAVLVGAWFTLAWRPASAHIVAAHERRHAAAQQVETLKMQLAGLRAAARHVPQLELDAGQLRAAVPDDPQLALLLLEANDAATRSGVAYLTITPTPPAAPSVPGAASEIRLAIDVQGRYAQVLDFVDRLSSLPRALVVDTVSLTPEGPGPALRAAIGGRAFTGQSLTPPTTVAGAEGLGG